jgi:N-acetylneuraminic acid mutarotase/tRNA A-37 threonylcarbamoyl transferase component Bud32
MSQTRTCRKCGTAVPPGELDGLCPNCVARLAFVPEPDPADAGRPPTAALPVTTLRYFGDYELLEEIARGGMGVIYKARQLSLNRTVAIKMILTGQLASPADVQRFLAEAEAAANLQHPNIVAIHEIGQHEGQHYFSMDYIEGKNLAQVVHEFQDQGANPDFQRIARWVKALAAAIHYAHEKGTLHRDLKPSNVLIDAADQPHITDFGLAKRVQHDSDLTISGQIIGTPNFMPPEQAAAKRGAIGPQSDIYSLGAILYFALTGQPPFQGNTTQETLTKVLHDEPASPRALNSTIPRDLATICLKCLEKDPRRRYTSAKDLADDLGRFLRDEPIVARPTGAPEKLWRLCRRHRAASGLFVLLLLLAGLWLVRFFAPRMVPSMPILDAGGVSGVIGGKLYVTVGLDGYAGYRNYLYVYDPGKNTWEKLPSTPLPPIACAAGVLGGKLHLAGGIDWKSKDTRQLSVFDPVSNIWTNRAPMRTARQGCVGAVFNGKLYVVGGETGGEPVATLEVYDPVVDAWIPGPPMRTPRSHPEAAIIGSTLYVVGGHPARDEEPTGTVEALDFARGTWSNVKPLPHLRSSTFVAAWNGTLYVAGGNPPKLGETRALEAYHPDTDSWETLASMPAPSYGGAGAQVMNGRIWVIGGWTYARDKSTGDLVIAHNEVFIYDPVRNSWITSGRNR